MATQYYASNPMPIAANSKQPSGYPTHYQHQGYGTASVSPPERPASSTTSGRASYTASTASSNYGDYDSAPPTSGIDLMDLLNDRMTGAYDPLPMDHAVVKQAQTSGALNAKQRELLELQQLAQQRLAATQANFAEGIKTAKEVKRDLEWTQKRVNSLNRKAAAKYPAQYTAAQAAYPSYSDY